MRVIDTITHQLSGVQILVSLANLWQENPKGWAILLIRHQSEASMMNTIRVSLSKERKSRKIPRTFELRHALVSTQLWVHGCKADALVIGRVSGRKGTVIRAAMHRLGGTDLQPLLTSEEQA